MNKNKQIIMVLLLVASAIGTFLYFNKTKEDVSSTAVASAQKTSSFIEGKEILEILNKLKNVTLSVNIFSNEIFKSLIDGTVSPIYETPSRNNPFAPFGVGNVNSGAPAQNSTTTGSQSGVRQPAGFDRPQR
jgi:hypothetical protein